MPSRPELHGSSADWPEPNCSVAGLLLWACRLELLALKPGNVHVHRDGHGMTVRDFLLSAEAAVPELCRPGRMVGERILAAVRATQSVVGCNTNLGIVLLAAPLVQAAEWARPGETLRQALRRVLEGLTVSCARAAYEAIRLASPGGLGRAERHDVVEEPRVTLLEAMQTAARRDRIAAQYATTYADIFGIGIPRLRNLRRRGADPVRALELTYLEFLASFPDSHVVRKHGESKAAWVISLSRQVHEYLGGNPSKDDIEILLDKLDSELKGQELNPGTTADLTVNSLFAYLLEDRILSDPHA